MSDLLAQLAASLPYALAAILALVVVVALVVWILVRRAHHAPWDTAAAASSSASTSAGAGGGGGQGWLGGKIGDLRGWIGAGAVRRSFAMARRDLGRSGGIGRGGAYSLPWCLMLGQASAGKSTLSALCGLDLPFGEPLAGGRGGSAGPRL